MRSKVRRMPFRNSARIKSTACRLPSIPSSQRAVPSINVPMNIFAPSAVSHTVAASEKIGPLPKVPRRKKRFVCLRRNGRMPTSRKRRRRASLPVSAFRNTPRAAVCCLRSTRISVRRAETSTSGIIVPPAASEATAPKGKVEAKKRRKMPRRNMFSQS